MNGGKPKSCRSRSFPLYSLRKATGSTYIIPAAPKKKRELKQKPKMEGHVQAVKSRVVKVDSEESWDFFINQANNQGCPVAVHFTASWCVPSVAMKPYFEEMALSFPDVLFLSVDVDEVKAAASKMGVKAMPTFVLLKDGKQIDKLVGANREEIRRRIDQFALSTRSPKRASS